VQIDHERDELWRINFREKGTKIFLERDKRKRRKKEGRRNDGERVLGFTNLT